jgi:hypothetical protein
MYDGWGITFVDSSVLALEYHIHDDAI